MNTEHWHAVGRWVVEDCTEQPEEPMPLFQCDLPANAVTVANIYNEVCTERDAAVAENARLLARIAAVEQAVRDARTIAPCPITSPHSPHGHSPTTASPGGVALCRGVAALAASPTPTGPELATEDDSELPGMWERADFIGGATDAAGRQR